MPTDRPVVENINGTEYIIGQLSAMEQWHVARRLSPILGELSGAFKRMAASQLFNENKDAPEDPIPTKTVEQIQTEVEDNGPNATEDTMAAPEPSGNMMEDPKMLEMFDILAKPITTAISTMSNADSEYIIRTCLSAVKRRQKMGAVDIVERNSGALRFHDINLRTMLQLTVRVIMENLGDFFPMSL